MTIDAHNHLQSPELASYTAALPENYKRDSINFSVVNGTRESDWPLVTQIAESYPALVRPSYGLHPWYIAERSPDWNHDLENLLQSNPRALIGECGLDHWMRQPDKEGQKEIFKQHLQLAHRFERVCSIHCLKAWGNLKNLMETIGPPPKGFLLHSYSGPIEMIDHFSQMGAYFSFSGYFLIPEKAQHLERFRQIPRDRLLLETDAPSMPPPINFQQRDERTLADSSPANLTLIAKGLAHFLQVDHKELIKLTTTNSQRLYA